MGALSASVYLLTYCRPKFNSTFCYYIETPKFINLNYYQINSFCNSLQCIYHEKLNDHSINFYNSCTDYRAWSLDEGQRRRHFFDIISRHIPHCGEEKHSQEENVKTNKPYNEKEKKEDILIALSERYPIEEKPQELEIPIPAQSPRTNNEPQSIEVENIVVKDTIIADEATATKTETFSEPPVGDSSAFTDEILEKLDCNLSNLESTFDRFVCKNRDFIQNLIDGLNFEKQRQEDLKRNHCKVKQENDILRAKNEYLRMVNAKQMEFFKNELEKAISENKTCFLKQVQHYERTINCNKEELQYYKKNETKLLKIVENEKLELHKLKNDINNLKCKEAYILRNYVKVLNFLDDVKKTIGEDSRGCSHLQRSSQTIGDSEDISNLDEVLRNALYNGIESLNVRDLSILHDSIQELNKRLCHQNEYCGRNPVMSVHISDQMFYEEYNKGSSTDYFHKTVQDYESSLSIVPSRQGPDRTTVYCSPR